MSTYFALIVYMTHIKHLNIQKPNNNDENKQTGDINIIYRTLTSSMVP